MPIDLTDATVDEHILLLCNIVHCADLGASTKPWHLCRQWSTRIIDEFFNQVGSEMMFFFLLLYSSFLFPHSNRATARRNWVCP